MARKTETTNLWTVVQIMEVTGALQGERICITGHLSAPRKEIHAIIEQAGGTCHDDVKWDTTILVSNNDWTATTLVGGTKSSKALKAEKQKGRTRVINEQMLVDLIVSKGNTPQMGLDK